MSIVVPDHDTLITHIKCMVIDAVHMHGWTKVREACPLYDVSPTVVRTIYLWEPKDNRSFNFQKLLNVYDLVYDLINKAENNKLGSCTSNLEPV